VSCQTDKDTATKARVSMQARARLAIVRRGNSNRLADHRCYTLIAL